MLFYLFFGFQIRRGRRLWTDNNKAVISMGKIVEVSNETLKIIAVEINTTHKF